MFQFKRIFIVICGIYCITTLLSCITTPVCITSSTTPIYGKMNIEKLGRAAGSSSAYSILGLWMIGKPDAKEAIEEALLVKNAHSLVDVYCYQTWQYFLFFSITTVYVEGEAVRIFEGK